MHIARRVQEEINNIHGTLTLLFDADEHTGGFGGAKQYFGEHGKGQNIRGVMIGYPGIDELVVGGRGFLRAEITIHGEAGHTGSQHAANHVNAAEKAAELVNIFTKHRIPRPIDATLGLPPKLTVTKISGGQSYSIIPDYCTVNVDIRLTTSFDQTAAKQLIEDAVTAVDDQWPLPGRPTEVKLLESWPAYRLNDNAPIRAALTRAATRHLGTNLTAKVAGPSNIGNYLAKLGIDSTAGFGVTYSGLHGTDERIDVSTIPAVQAVYHEAVLDLLTPEFYS